MKAVRKGIALGIVVSLLTLIFSLILKDNFYKSMQIVIPCFYAVTVIAFLSSKKWDEFFTVLGASIVVFIFFAIMLLRLASGSECLFVLMFGFLGSVAGLVIAAILTAINKKTNLLLIKGEPDMDRIKKIKLLIYGLITFLSFTYLILPEKAGVSVPIFFILQFIMLWFIVPKRKALWLFIPIFVLSLNSFISANDIFRVSNFIVIMVLYGLMFIKIDWLDTTSKFLVDIFVKLVEPINYFKVPFKWVYEINRDKTDIIKRILIALLITVPIIIILILILSSADIIFSKNSLTVYQNILNSLNINMILKSIYGILVAFYGFGLLYCAHIEKTERNLVAKNNKKGDLIILNILLISILVIYTMFVVIQFKYLFSNSELPDGLTYTTYARKGFFELLFLTGVNVILILLTVHLTKDSKRLWSRFTKFLCCYLCVVTMVLLISSFYRMWLYNADDGLTRLRFMVFGFLFFEQLGLMVTFVYILKPKFNITAIYLFIALCYYMILNIVPMDYFIAKSQVDRHFKNFDAGIAYVTTLSLDAAPQIERLLESETEAEKAQCYFESNELYYNKELLPRWQRYNLSISKAIREQ